MIIRAIRNLILYKKLCKRYETMGFSKRAAEEIAWEYFDDDGSKAK